MPEWFLYIHFSPKEVFVFAFLQGVTEVESFVNLILTSVGLFTFIENSAEILMNLVEKNDKNFNSIHIFLIFKFKAELLNSLKHQFWLKC